jgi:hypothetical protein
MNAPPGLNRRASVYLTDASPAGKKATLARQFPVTKNWSPEREAEAAVKRDKPILVVLGNTAVRGSLLRWIENKHGDRSITGYVLMGRSRETVFPCIGDKLSDRDHRIGHDRTGVPPDKPVPASFSISVMEPDRGQGQKRQGLQGSGP